MKKLEANNQSIIQSWVKTHNLKNLSTGITEFIATFEVLTDKNTHLQPCAKCSFTMGGYEIPKVKILNFDGSTSLFPSEFWISNCNFIGNQDVLEIHGTHPYDVIGKYSAYIRL